MIPNVSIADGSTGCPERLARIEAVVASTLARRHAGEPVSDARVIAEHSDLLPELAKSLRTANDVRRAYRAARRAGLTSSAEALDVLDDDQLDAPISTTDCDGRSAGDAAAAVPTLTGYEIVSELPRGGQALVYLARQVSTGRRVAVKVLTEGRFASARARRRFEREAEILAALDHPNLVSVVDAGTAKDGAPFLVMPYIDGRSLDDHLVVPATVGGLGGADAVAVLALFERLARAVHAAHVASVIHRDLKPSNIRVDHNGEPRVLDFGLACLLEDESARAASVTSGESASTLTRAQQILGSPAWMSPEQAGGSSADADGRADVYALGVMLYQALSGRSPYPETSPPHRVLAHVLGTEPPPPSSSPTARRGVTDEIDAVVLTCLAKDRDARYPTAAALAEDLARCRAGQRPVAMVGYAPVVRTRSPGRTRRSWGWAWASAAATVGVAAAVTEGLGLGLLGPGRRVVIPPPALSVDRYASAAGTTRPAIHITPFIGTAVVQIPPARFEVPNPAGGAPRKVEVTRPFWIGMTEVTRGQFARLMGKPGGTVLAADADLPVVNITQAEAQEYCRRLGTHDRIRYRLPTEPEWELAARFGARALAAGGPPSYASVSGRRTVPVQSLIRSAIGLRGMAGDVAEWCDDGSGDLTGVIRGGPFAGPVALGTTGSMRTLPATERRPNVGFRVAADVISAPSRNDLPPQK